MSQVASAARTQRREQIIVAARALVGASVADFNAIRTDICAVDVVMVAGSPWLKDGLERDYAKDESGYQKIGGGGNTPERAYFFRSGGNLIHYLKRSGFYVPRGGEPTPTPGMACFFDWEDRGRFNFTPDRSGIIISLNKKGIDEVVLAQKDENNVVHVGVHKIEKGDPFDMALIGYSDLP